MISGWREGRLHPVAGDDLVRLPAGGRHDEDGALTQSRRWVADLLGREGDLRSVRGPCRIEPGIGDPANGFACRSGDEDAAGVIRLVKGEERAIRRERWCPFIARRIVDDGSRIASAHALRVDVPAAVHARRERDGGAVG